MDHDPSPGTPGARFRRAREALVSVFNQRCFYLFAALLLLIILVPFMEGSRTGRLVLNIVNVLVLVAAAVAVSRSRLCLTLAAMLGALIIACQVLARIVEEPALRIISAGFGTAFYFLTVSYLLAYVIRREVLTLDKLYGAAAAYLMLGILWFYFYLILLHFHPGAFAIAGNPMLKPVLSEILYFSFTVLTSTGFGDIVPAHPMARMLCVLQQILGVLYIAILIARLAGTYAPYERR